MRNLSVIFFAAVFFINPAGLCIGAGLSADEDHFKKRIVGKSTDR